MSRRRSAHYLRDAGDVPPGSQKPTAQGPQLSRAWLERTDECDAAAQGAWRMTIEHEMQYATNHVGDFGELVSLAAQGAVTEYYVWSSEVNDFVLCSKDTVSQHDL
ncbi:MAG TPA: hypothetical protein VHR39_16705 [Propionibacteriaceae bacterium]|nr:hypothetical protein [Propionibacteriaceae bacterium]